MTRIAVIADSHFDESSRFEECRRVHQWIAEDLRQRCVDLVLHAGDVYERRSTATERLAVAQWVREVAEVAPVVMVRGNHDALGDLPLLERLRTKHRVIVEEAARVHHIAGVAVAALAWPRKSELLARLPAASREAGEQTAADALRAVLLGLGQQLAAHDGPRVLLAHAMVRGSRVSTGQPLVGCDLEIGVEDLTLVSADAYALGHIHLPQSWGDEMAEHHPSAPGPIFYPGSPRRTAYGEVEEKGYVLLDVEGDDGTRATVQRIPTPCAPMLLVEGIHDPDNGVIWIPLATSTELASAEIRLRYEVQRDHRDAARALAAMIRDGWLRAGAADVKVEERVVEVSTARAPEVATATSLGEKLVRMWSRRGDEPSPERVERLLAIAHDLEAQERAA